MRAAARGCPFSKYALRHVKRQLYKLHVCICAGRVLLLRVAVSEVPEPSAVLLHDHPPGTLHELLHQETQQNQSETVQQQGGVIDPRGRST